MKFTIAMKHNWLLKKISWTKYWIVKEDFIWYVDYIEKKWRIVVPKWFTTDMASIPRPLWIFLNPTKFIAPILHDYLYTTKELTRADADLILLEALNIEWANILEKTCYYWGVRIGWWLPYYLKK